MKNTNSSAREKIENRLFVLGKTKADLAREMGTYPVTIFNILSGKKRPKIPTTKAMAKALEMDERELRALLLELAS